ncbi:MAG TPA: hypothetical protein VFS67_36710 [Polyangiaceae bacterium]|nr:hypothetical protein [Polyangiaceae bacterium]
MSWPAVFAGSVLSLGIWLLLYLLGLGVGLTVIDPNQPRSLHGAGMTTGIWSLIVPIVAMFVGALAAAKVGGAMTRTAAAIQGGVLWSLATIASIFALLSVVASLIGGAARLGAGAAEGLGEIARSVAPRALNNISGEELLAPINDRLRASGNPPISAEQMNDAFQMVMESTIRSGGLNREDLVRAVTESTALSSEQAIALADSLEQRLEQTTGRAAAQAQTAALTAAESTGKGLIGMFFAMLLGLIAAVAGSIAGISRGQRAVAERVRERAEMLAERHA